MNGLDEERVQIREIRYFSSNDVTFDELVTKSYIYDQVAVMEMCFMQARREGIDWVLHIDFDEYMHFGAIPGQNTLKEAMQRAQDQCSADFGDGRVTLSLVRPHGQSMCIQ